MINPKMMRTSAERSLNKSRFYNKNIKKLKTGIVKKLKSSPSALDFQQVKSTSGAGMKSIS
jgi:hypothetical protein